MPTSAFGARVVGPARSTLSPDQLKASRSDPLSFRRSAGRSARPSKKAVRDWLGKAHEAKALRTVSSRLFAYRLATAQLTATGVVGEVSLNAYRDGVVKGHEKTIAKNQARMVNYMRDSGIYGNIVALAHRPNALIAAAVETETARASDVSFTTIDGTSHWLWALDSTRAEQLCASLDEPLYVIDGHHRLAAAAALAEQEGSTDPSIPVGLFCTDTLEVRSFFRCVTDPEIDLGRFVRDLGRAFQLEDAEQTSPRTPGEIAVRAGVERFLFKLGPITDCSGPVGSLDVSRLRSEVLEPLLGIGDASRDSRLTFVADTGDSGEQDACTISFLTYPVSLDDVLTVADLGQMMPPKSTSFAPKLPSGLAIRLRDQ